MVGTNPRLEATILNARIKKAYNKNKIDILVEAKGYFRVGDTQKYKAIRDSLPKKRQLVFLLYNPNKKLRKGSKMNMSEWCEKEGFKWYTLEDITDAFIK